VTVLLVASPGGHVEELRLLAPRLGIAPDEVQWVTSRTPQTESLLAGESVHWMPHVGSGDLLGAARMLPAAVALQRRVRPRLVASTGAAAAAPHLVAAALARCPVTYVESATRVAAPSQTGRLAQRLPRTTLFVQGVGWGDRRWTPIADVFDAFEVTARPGPAREVRSAVVTLGTERFPFQRAVERTSALLEGRDVFWQTGSTRAELSGQPLAQWVDAEELRAACRGSDVLITHGGVGSALVALESGKVPIILPRRSDRGEHIDDHQLEVAGVLAGRGLAICVDPDELTEEHLQAAFGLVARQRRPGDGAATPG
jgi:UDP-N-acetylglucosamine--N-acetylmuramyl-(pentapeptide) pyrophosphoryl-undecaprenol N-acetylglucosamine transferase